jgi:ArsR family transcriptional regulator
MGVPERDPFGREERPEHAGHRALVEWARGALEDEALFLAASGLFRLLADPTRLKILALLDEREMSVCCLAAALGAGQSAISHQLRLLRTCGAVRCRREGTTVWYGPADPRPFALLRSALGRVEEEATA